jgi:hypothetical protein
MGRRTTFSVTWLATCSHTGSSGRKSFGESAPVRTWKLNSQATQATVSCWLSQAARK